MTHAQIAANARAPYAAKKTYQFRFISQSAAFERGFVTTVYGALVLANESKTCTLGEAIAYLPVFSASIAVPNAARFRIDSDERAPSGYHKANRIFNFNPADTHVVVA